MQGRAISLSQVSYLITPNQDKKNTHFYLWNIGGLSPGTVTKVTEETFSSPLIQQLISEKAVYVVQRVTEDSPQTKQRKTSKRITERKNL